MSRSNVSVLIRFSVTVVLASIIGCGVGRSLPTDGDVTLSEETILVDQEPSIEVQEVGSNTLLLTVSSGTSPVSEGDILTGRGPDGAFLRKVVGLETQPDGTVKAFTEQASLEEAVIQGAGSVSTQVFFDGSDSGHEGKGLRSGKVIDHLVKTLVDNASVDASITLSVDFNPHVDVNVRYDRGLEYFLAKVTGKLDIDLEVEVIVKEAIREKYEQELAEIPGAPIYFAIGFVPVEVLPVLEIIAGVEVDAAAAGSADCGAGLTLTTTAGVEFESGEWSVIAENETEYRLPQMVYEFPVSADAKVYVKAQVLLKFYRVAGPTIGLAGALGFEAEGSLPGDGIDWELYWALIGSAGGKIEILSQTVAAFGFDLFEVRFPILEGTIRDGGEGEGEGGGEGEGEGENEAPIAKNQAVAVAFDTPTRFELDVSDSDDGPEPLVYVIVEEPEHGAITGTGTTPTYTPDVGYTGRDSFTYYVTDGVDDSRTAKVSITVSPPGEMGSPNLVSPIGGASVEMVPVFDWNPVPGAVEYQIDLSANDLFSPVLWSTKSEPTAIAYNTPPLEDGTYYWRVLPIDIDDNEGPYSSSATFTKSWTLAPSLLEPADGARISTGLVLEWTHVSSADHYQIVLSTSEGFSTVFEEFDSHVTRVGWTPNPPDATYYWHVRAVDVARNEGPWSSAGSFTIAWTAVPTLVSPIGGAGASSAPVFQWTSLPGVGQYEIHMSANIEFTNVFWNTKSHINRVAYTPALGDGNTYYWRVRCLDAEDKPGPWTSIASFLTTGLPGGGNAPPTLTSPPDGASMSEMPLLSWSAVAGAAYYRVEISRNELFSDTVDSRRTVNTVYVPEDYASGQSSKPSSLGNLSPGTYYWRVRAYDEDHDEIGDWSAIPSFQVTPAVAVTLTAPSDGAILTEMPMLEWSPLPAAEYYKVEIS